MFHVELHETQKDWFHVEHQENRDGINRSPLILKHYSGRLLQMT